MRMVLGLLFLVGYTTTVPGDTASPVPDRCIAKAANGMGIAHPASKKTYAVTAGGKRIAVPEGMVYIPEGDFTFGARPNAKKVHLAGYCIGRFDVTNAEYKAFLDSTRSTRAPSYWPHGTYPDGKANHPVVYVSFNDAMAYAEWVARQTAWKVTLPTSEQWENAARGPQGLLYPWGNAADIDYRDGKLITKFNCNAVTAAFYLQNHPKMAVTYDNPKSKYVGTKTTVDQIAGYDESGHATVLAVGPSGMVRGWVSHSTYTGFIYTDLFTSLNKAGGNTSAVGSYENGKSVYGCYDMAGNVWNWCDTKIVATNGAEKGKTVNEIRGGSWYATARSCQSASIDEGRAAMGAYNTVGFRIVMLPTAAQ